MQPIASLQGNRSLGQRPVLDSVLGDDSLTLGLLGPVLLAALRRLAAMRASRVVGYPSQSLTGLVLSPAADHASAVAPGDNITYYTILPCICQLTNRSALQFACNLCLDKR